MGKLNRAVDYSEMQIRTAGKMKGILLLHEAGLRYVHKALEQPERRKEFATKALNTAVQLQMALRLEGDGVSEALFLLYDYLYRLLDRADDAALNESIRVFEHLTETFRLLNRVSRPA